MTSFAEIATLSTAGMGAGLGFFMVKWLAEWASSRWDKRADLIDHGTELLIEQLQAQIKAILEREVELQLRLQNVEASLVECTRQHTSAQIEIENLRNELNHYKKDHP